MEKSDTSAICSICNKKTKVAGSSYRQTDDGLMMMCEQCAIKAAALQEGISIEEAAEKRRRGFGTILVLDGVFQKFVKEKNADSSLPGDGLMWWNKLSIEEKKEIGMLPEKAQRRVFLDLAHGLASIRRRPKVTTLEIDTPEIDDEDLCPCGSGKKSNECCFPN